MNQVKSILILLFAFSTIIANAQNNTLKGKTDVEQQIYLQVEEIPNSIYILPPPPEYNSTEFLNDQFQYYHYKNLRDTERGKKAVTDATLDGLNGMNNAFSEAFGTEITLENTPETFLLVRSIGRDAGGLAGKKAKRYYKRIRPFVMFNDKTSTPENEEHMRNSGSYPSGHSSYGWAAALILTELNPDRKNEILKRGYEIGESRMIVGAHYASDIHAGRIMAAATVAVLHSNAAFQKQLSKAKKEIEQLRKEGKIKPSDLPKSE